MSVSEQKLAANRLNALSSTGPTSAMGKSKSSRNATRHGLLSTRLVLNNEDPAALDALLFELQSSLAPVGFLELALVERIAITLWRQRRLVTAETAALSLARTDHKTAEGVSQELKGSRLNPLTTEDLKPFDKDQVRFCKAVLSEVEQLEEIKLDSLPKLAPTIFGQLKSDAEDDDVSIEEHLEGHDKGVTGYVDDLVRWCQDQLREAEQRPRTLALAEQVRARCLVLPEDALEVLSRYQTTLDNQLFKALKALRDAQAWRLKTLDASAVVLSTETEDAA